MTAEGPDDDDGGIQVEAGIEPVGNRESVCVSREGQSVNHLQMKTTIDIPSDTDRQTIFSFLSSLSLTQLSGC